MPVRVLSLLIVIQSVALSAEAPDFHQQVLPIFRKHCVGCHNGKDAEAGLVLQDYVRTIKGGDNGTPIVAGHPDQSLLWKRITASDDTRMPPKDQPAPTASEIQPIKDWIAAGAKPPTGDAPISLMTPRIPVTATVRQGITSIATSADGQSVAIAKPHQVEILQSTGNRKLTGHSGQINEVSFSRDGKWLCVAAGEIGLIGEATLWNTSDWTRGPVIQGHRDALYSAQISPDGLILATASYDRDLMTWEIPSGKALNTFKGHNDAIYGITFSSDGKLLATSSGDRTVKLWNTATGQRLDTLSQPSKEQLTAVFSPDGRQLAAAGADCRIRVWQISESGREGTNPILYARFAHEGPILKLAFSPDGRLLASSSEDRRIKFWETTTWTQVAVLDRQPDWPSALAFSADSRQLLVGLMNGESLRFPIDPKWLGAVNRGQILDDATHRSNIDIPVEPAKSEEAEPNDDFQHANRLTIPSHIQGKLKQINGASPDVDLYQFIARRGEKFVLETNASRTGSQADTKLDVLSAEGRPVLRALLQSVRDSWINFRPIDSSAADVRVEFWEEMDLNQYLYLSGEVCKTYRAPQGPDSGYQLYASDGKRRNYFDTSATAHAKDEPAYIVEALAPTSTIVDNGLPVFPLYFSNDDDGDRKLGKDSRLIFTAPEDGVYLAQVSDVRGFSGEQFSYSLTVRHPEPDFLVTVNTMNPKIPAGSGQRLKFLLNRIDGFTGPVRIDIAGLPKGFQASSPITVQPGLLETFSVITAEKDAAEPTKEDWQRITVLATAEIDGRLMTRTVGNLGEPVLEKPAAIRVFLQPDDPKFATEDNGLVIEPGTTITAKIVVERNGHDGDVRFEVDNLPHGIIVDNIGLSGVLVRKDENERTIFLTARPWVPETSRLIHAVAQGVGNQASPAIRLSVRRGNSVAAKSN